MYFQIIESSSSGNCAYLDCGDVKILIDAGVGVVKTKKYLEAQNICFDDISAVFITHDHIDHYRMLKSLVKYKHLKIFANVMTMESITNLVPECGGLNWICFENNKDFDFLDIKIKAFSVYHDATDPVGYKFTHQAKTLVYSTDFGKITAPQMDIFRKANVLAMECNHCPKMLSMSNRGFRAINRVLSDFGHISNETAMNIIKNLDANIVEKIYLCHVSKDCNEIPHINEYIAKLENLKEIIEIVSPFKDSSKPYSF